MEKTGTGSLIERAVLLPANVCHGFRIITVIMLIAVYGCEDKVDHPDNLSQNIFHSPSDGKLTEKQVIDYIVIRRKIIDIVNTQKTEKAMLQATVDGNPVIKKEVRGYYEIEKEAANSLNMSYAEYLWVKDRVISTQTKMLVQQYYDLNDRIIMLLDETLQDYKANNTKSGTAHKKSSMDGYVAEMRQEIKKIHRTTVEPGEGAEALQHNIVIITEYIKELESMERKTLQPFVAE